MASFVYNAAQSGIIGGSIVWASSNVKAMLVSAAYSQLPSDQFVSQIPAPAIIARSGALTNLGVSSSNVFFGTIPQFLQLASLVSVVALVLYIDTGNDSTSKLIYYSSDGIGFPFKPQTINYYIGFDQTQGGWFQLVQTTTPPFNAQPFNVQASSSIPYTSTTVTWAIGPQGNQVAYYLIYRSTDGVNYNHLGNVQGANLTYTDNTTTNCQTYYYQIVAQDASGNQSLPSTALLYQTPCQFIYNTYTIPGTYTWTVPSNMGLSAIGVLATAVGGGGGGGAGGSAGGNGGGGGGYASGTLNSVPGGSVTVTVGAGGTGGTPGSGTVQDGATGNSSSFGNFVIGGAGGGGRTSVNNNGPGGNAFLNSATGTTSFGANGNGAFSSGHGGPFPGNNSTSGAAGGAGGGYNNFDSPFTAGYVGGTSSFASGGTAGTGGTSTTTGGNGGAGVSVTISNGNFGGAGGGGSGGAGSTGGNGGAGGYPGGGGAAGGMSLASAGGSGGAGANGGVQVRTQYW